MQKAVVDRNCFNPDIEPTLPYSLRNLDFEHAMEDVYGFFHDVNALLIDKGLERLDDMLRPAAMSGMISDMATAALAKASRGLVANTHFNGHPDLILRNLYPNDGVAAGEHGIEIKSTINESGAVDTHGARDQWMCVFVYEVDSETQPATARRPMQFTAVYLAKVTTEDFRSNRRLTEKGTRTATLHKEGIKKLRAQWIYRTESIKERKQAAARAERIAAREAKKAGKKPVKTIKAKKDVNLF